MSVGLLIITHERIGAALVETAVGMLGRCPLKVDVLPIPGDCDLERLNGEAREKCQALDEGDGVLVLTDIYGGTPSNIAGHLARSPGVAMVAGVNLPMLVRVMNYPQLDLAGLTEKAVSGGRDGVLECRGGAL